MKPFLRNFILGIAAGVAIALGGAANVIAQTLADPSLAKILGSFLFPIGLITVCSFGFFLYTGKIGYLLDNPNKNYVLSLLAGFLGNLVGAVLIGLVCLSIDGFSGYASKFAIETSFDNPLTILEALGRGFLCGIFVFVGVDIYKRKGGVFGILGVWLATAAFVFIGAWHCIANMFYLTAAKGWNLGTIFTLVLVIIGNSVGSLFIRLLLKLTEKKEEEEKNS